MRYFLKFALLFWMAVPLALAQAPKADTTRADTTKADTTKADTARVETILGPGDVVRATVFQNPDLTVESRISESGQINFPLIGAVTVGGLAIPAAEKRIETLLRERGFVLRPQVTIQVVRTLSSQVSVLGQVGKPGRYPIETVDAKVSEMVAAAGGVLPGGADVVNLVGTRDGKPVKLDIDLPAILQAGRAELDVTVKNGDILFVDRAPSLYIYGEVQRPGQIRLERGMTLLQALAAGGGVSARGTERGIRVHRKDVTGTVKILELKPNDPVQRDDVVYVRESIF